MISSVTFFFLFILANASGLKWPKLIFAAQNDVKGGFGPRRRLAEMLLLSIPSEEGSQVNESNFRDILSQYAALVGMEDDFDNSFVSPEGVRWEVTSESSVIITCADFLISFSMDHSPDVKFGPARPTEAQEAFLKGLMNTIENSLMDTGNFIT